MFRFLLDLSSLHKTLQNAIFNNPEIQILTVFFFLSYIKTTYTHT